MAEEKRTFKVEGKKVHVHHKTQTLDNKDGVWFDTTFDFSACSEAQILKWAADQRTIAWRAGAGVKKLTEAEINEKGLLNVTVDCSKTVERVKHVETAEEKELKDAINAALSAGKIKNMAEVAKMLKELAAKKDEEEMEASEDATAE